jgi:hypothetical protein
MNNNKYNPMTPSEDYLQKFQWSVHSVKRCSQLFKTLVSDGWSCAGAISPNKDMTTNINEFSLTFYWRKYLNKTTYTDNTTNTDNNTNTTSYFNTPHLNSPIFKFDVYGLNRNIPPTSPPAREVEENIIIDNNNNNNEVDYFFDSDEMSIDGHTDNDETFFDSFNNK